MRYKKGVKKLSEEDVEGLVGSMRGYWCPNGCGKRCFYHRKEKMFYCVKCGEWFGKELVYAFNRKTTYGGNLKNLKKLSPDRVSSKTRRLLKDKMV